MNSALQSNLFFIKEHVGIFKASVNYDILDPNTGAEIMQCREINLGFFAKIFRFTKYKRATPFHLEIKTPDGKMVLSVKRGVSFLAAKVSVFDENETLVGYLKQKLFSFTGKFDVLDINNNKLGYVKGKWTGWDYKFYKGEKELAKVDKKWAGIGKELFTSADNYMLSIDSSLAKDDKIRILILAAVLSIDMVLKR